MKTVFRTILSYAVVFFIAMPMVGRSQNAKDFDYNENGRIDSGKESEAFLRHVNDNLFRELDKNKNGEIEPAERASYEQQVQTKVDRQLEEFKINSGQQNSVSIIKANDLFAP